MKFYWKHWLSERRKRTGIATGVLYIVYIQSSQQRGEGYAAAATVIASWNIWLAHMIAVTYLPPAVQT